MKYIFGNRSLEVKFYEHLKNILRTSCKLERGYSTTNFSNYTYSDILTYFVKPEK